MNFDTLSGYMMAFAYYYPLFMSYVWMSGGIYYRFHWEEAGGGLGEFDRLEPIPPVSIIVPCYNEQNHIQETVSQILKTGYSNYEIILVNDGSSDETGKIIDQLSHENSIIRVIHLEKNCGKANALNVGAVASKNEILVCIDGDAMLDEYAVGTLVKHFIYSPRVGAVTGNPRVRNRSTLLGKIQVGEFSSIIGLIKRAQRIYGRVFTISGVVTAFRKSALQRIGFWRSDTTTDDIDVSWRLQLDHWDIRYEPNALCWILMPETYRGLWKQRLRWAVGGAQAAMFYAADLFKWKSRRMWMVYLEYWLSVVWSYILVCIILLWVIGKFIQLPEQIDVPSLVPGWHGLVLGATCLMQFLVSLLIDKRYEDKLLRHFFWIVWYPLAYWMINVFTTAAALPKAIFMGRNKTGTWTSPDRGFIANEDRR